MRENDVTQLSPLHNPLDSGGRISRAGLSYQDWCALRYCIHAALTGAWDEVWCESHEDIILVRDDKRRLRFIQVKSIDASNQHWSCSWLCKNETSSEEKNNEDSTDSINDTENNKCIIIKLFSKDIYPQTVTDFRLVTNEGVMDELREYHYRWGKNEPPVSRQAHCFSKLRDNLQRRFPRWFAENFDKIDNWLSQFGIEQHAGNRDELRACVLEELERLLIEHNRHLYRNERDKVLILTYNKVCDAANADRTSVGFPGNINIAEFRNYLLEQADFVSSGSQVPSTKLPGKIIEEQLSAIGISQHTIAECQAARIRYIQEHRAYRGTKRGKQVEMLWEDIRGIVLECNLEVDDSSTEPVGRLLFNSIFRRIKEYKQTHWKDDPYITFFLLTGICMEMLHRGSLVLVKLND